MRLTNSDIAPGHLRTILRSLDEFGLTDAMPETRKVLARANTLRRADGSREAQAEHNDLPRQVADGEVSLADAVSRAAELAPWVSVGDAYSPARRIAERAAELVERRALVAAKDERDAALAAIVRVADGVVADAVRAGREIVGDVTARTMLEGYVRGDRPACWGVSVATLGGTQLSAWGHASEATGKFTRLRKLAAELHQLSMPGVRGVPIMSMSSPPAIGSERAMVQDSPEPLQLAVMSNSGWQPGLVIDGALPPTSEPIQREGGWSLKRLVGRR